jgi:hypothetical protein
MKILATLAHNKKYIWVHTFDKVKIEAILENDHVSYIEHYNGNVNTLPEELIRQLLCGVNSPVHDRPFLVKENIDFYIVLNRKREKYKNQYNQIVKKAIPLIEKPVEEKPKLFRRTK